MTATKPTELTETRAKAIFKKYLSNEDSNYHSENLVLLATTFGTQDEIEYCETKVKATNGAKMFLINSKIEESVNCYYQKLRGLAEKSLNRYELQFKDGEDIMKMKLKAASLIEALNDLKSKGWEVENVFSATQIES